ncbi:sel1 repeat family protein [Persicimonas caeni]|uniref:Sel1 repeat family protein n=1 Tax=Persicimonas caeni TaxID=2292766 RepID=A0A4Y6PW89_PERCE|nr:tetratricopeptide repeat protein [Persicimonas caeni]QDG52389.1 sel1 repeat family protein [Persicimonas caeni]QED33611.1 sel1 repeat family protein [Persicimonas caeni]
MHTTRLFAALAVSSLIVGCSTGSSTQNIDDTQGTKPTSASAAWEKAQSESPCKDVDARSCYFQGMKLEASAKPKQAIRYFKASCEREVASACYDLAVLYENGESVAKDEAKAKELYEQACQSQDPDAMACNNLAVMYQQGRAVEVDQDKAAELYRRACELGSMLGCRNLARRYLEGEGVEKSPARAAALLEKACQLGHPEACPQLTYLFAHDCVEGGECGAEILEPARSAQKLREMCEATKQPQACLGYGFMLEAGLDGEESDPAKAALQYDQACKAGVSTGCNYMANLYRRGDGVERDVERAVQLYDKACTEGFMLSCHTLGVMHLRGRSLPPDPKRGYEYIRKACEGGRSPSCTALEFQCFAGSQEACP